MPLNPDQFKDFVTVTNSGGGATLDLDSGSLIGNSSEGPHGYIVGGEKPRPGVAGERVSTEYIPRKKFNVKTAHAAATKLLDVADTSPGLGIGSYIDPNAGDNAPVEIDASRVHPTLKGAMELAQQRGEKSVWSTKLQQEIRTEDYLQNPKKYHDMVGELL